MIRSLPLAQAFLCPTPEGQWDRRNGTLFLYLLGAISITANILYAPRGDSALAGKKKEIHTCIFLFCNEDGSKRHLLKRIFISTYSSLPAQWKGGQEFYYQTSHFFGVFFFLSFQREIMLDIFAMKPKNG